MSNKTGYKSTKLGFVPVEWDVVKFSDIFSYIGTNSFSRDQLTYSDTSSKVFNIHYGDIHSKFESEILDFEMQNNIPLLAENIILNGNACYLMNGDLIIADASEDYEGVGASIELKNIGSTKVVSGLHTIVARDTTGKTVEGFRTYILHNPIISKALKRIATGISVYSISKTELSKIIVIIPSKNEQKKIATILSTWDESITKTQQLITQLQQRNKSLTRQLLTGMKRLKGFNKPWNEIPLAEVFVERNEIGYVNLNLLSVGSSGVYPQSQSEKRDTSNSDKARYKRICPGDIGYNTMRMWQGRSALSSLEGIVSPAYTVVTPKGNQHSEFYASLFKLPSVVNKFFRHSQGLVEDTLNCKFKDFAKVKIDVPEYKEQIAIAKVLSKVKLEIKSCEQKL